MDSNLDQKKLPRVRMSGAVVFDWVLLAMFLVLAVVGLKYNARARSIPVALGVIGGVMVLLQLLTDMFPSLRRTLGFVAESGLLAGQERRSSGEAAGTPDTNGGHEENEDRGRREWLKILRLILWLSAFILLLGVTHYLVAVGLFVVLVTRIEAKESWLRSLVLAACVNAGFFILFDLILKAQL